MEKEETKEQPPKEQHHTEHAEKSEKTFTLGYWDIRGLAQTLTYLLEYTKTPYTRVRYDGDDRANVLKETRKMGDFPNLPYLKIGDKIINESQAIAYAIVENAGCVDLMGKNEAQEI